MRSLEGYFDSLTAAAVNEKSVLENLVANNTKIAATNGNLVAMVNKLTNDINNLERETSHLKKGGQSKRYPTLCRHFKKGGYHAPEAFYELVKNKYKRPPGWRSLLWRIGTAIINSKISTSSDKLFTHHANFSPTLNKHLPSSLDTKATGIVDSRATDIYFSTNAPIFNIDLSAPKVKVGIATGKTLQSTGTGDLDLPYIPLGFPIKGHLMPSFCHTLIGVGPLCDDNCTVAFTREAVIVWDQQGTPVLTGWSEASRPQLWRIDLQPGEANLPNMSHDANMATLSSYGAYDLPSVVALVRYFHFAAGYPVRSTWLKDISAGNYSSWPGLTLANATKYCPSAEATIMGHLVQKLQGFRSTKHKPPTTSSPENPIPRIRSNELFIQVTPISKFYTDYTGRFPIHACSVNQYIMITYHCDANVILAEPFASRKDKHRLLEYDKLMQRLRDNKLTVDLQILNNEASAEYKQVIKTKWNTNYQLVSTNTHRRNAAERSIRTFKAYFLSILTGVAPYFRSNLWDFLLPQTELTLNLLWKSTLDPSISV